MRVRLTVQRNALPAAKILWTISDTNSTQAYTISRLLEDVNHVIPLESEHWGLEHYVVEIDGFECLHFSPVAETLKENDHVAIRPLMTAEVRARTLTGRDQITDDGRHLVDGIPFGRPYLRRPNRPDLRIPAPQEAREIPERRAIEAAPQDFELGPKAMELPEHLPAPLKGLLSGLDLSDPEQRQEAQESLALASVLSNLFGNPGPTSPPSGLNRSNPEVPSRATNGVSHAMMQNGHKPSKDSSRKVQFSMSEAQEDQLDSEEDDDDFELDDEEMEDNEDEDEDESESDSASSSASDTSSSDSDSDSDDSSSDSDEDSDASSAPEVRSSKGKLPELPVSLPTTSPNVAPGKGRRATQARNSRRTRTNRLRSLQQSGKLPSTATLKDLAEYEKGMPQQESHQSTQQQPFSNWTGKRKRVDGQEDDADDTITPERRQQALAALARSFEDDTANAVVEVEETLMQASKHVEPKSPQPQAAAEEPTEKEMAEKETPRKRLRPDTAAISRILARQAAPSPKRIKKTKAAESAPLEPEQALDPDFWKSRVNVSAFECWEEEFELSAPPFPFKQHWDPASTLMREKADLKRKGKRGKKVVREPEPSDEEEEKIILDYDDAPAATQDSEIKAAIDEQIMQDVETAAQQDLPPLPEDVTSLPELVPGEVKKGAVIVCKFFDINPVTVMPEISGYKTAAVEHEGDSGNGAGTIRLKLALRDLPKREKKFDKKGNQIYSAADQFFMDGEDEEEGVWEGQFTELLEPKLLQAA